VHDSVFVIAHFHCMVLVVATGAFAAVAYWWPKVFGFKLDEHNGKLFFWTFVLGSVVVFVPMFGLGLEGETRRLDYIFNPQWRPLLIAEEVGIVLYCISIFYFLKMIYVSLRDRVPAGDDAWGTGRTLEWMTHTPVPFYNFAVTPQINALDELAWRRENGLDKVKPETFVPIHMPSNTAVPVIIGVLAMAFGFGMIWRIWWMAGAALLAIIVAVIARSFDKNQGYILTAEEIAKLESKTELASVIAEQPKRAPLDHVEAH
jgi:cytochrome o ubiquinol oxidase subunit 1